MFTMCIRITPAADSSGNEDRKEKFQKHQAISKHSGILALV